MTPEHHRTMNRLPLTIAFVTLALTAAAQHNLQMPLVYLNSGNSTATTPETPADPGLYNLDAGDGWLTEACDLAQRQEQLRHRVIIANPQMVAFNDNALPEPPAEYALTADPAKSMLTVEVPKQIEVTDTVLDVAPVKIHDWLHTFDGSLHFTQAYISHNWYQGGENNLNILADIKWDFNLNQATHPNWLFNNMLQYKLGISTAQGDSLRKYMINEDNFLFTSQLGYKAVKHWYYSAMLQFKTQFFQNFKSNTNDLTASFLSPGELNLGIGMTYDYKNADQSKAITVAIAPLSYNLKICRDIDKIDPTTFGIEAGHHTKSSLGSNVEAKFSWKITPSISWNSRLYVFTDYKFVQGDWENTFDFSVTRHLNTKIYTHLRYDKSHPKDVDWKYWQFKEILSFGIVYHFATSE